MLPQLLIFVTTEAFSRQKAQRDRRLCVQINLRLLDSLFNVLFWYCITHSS